MAEDEQGRRRLEDEKDYVRIEIASALKRGIPVIPVLLDGTPMPSQSELPDYLKSLTRRQALELRHTRIAVDADAIVSALKHRLPKKRKPWVGFLAAAACLIVGVGLGLIFYFRVAADFASCLCRIGGRFDPGDANELRPRKTFAFAGYDRVWQKFRSPTEARKQGAFTG